MRHFTENDMMNFARVASGGAYGLYTGCKTLDQKLKKYKYLKKRNMGWIYNGVVFEDNMIPEDAVGFIYEMTAIIERNGFFKSVSYIGKKNFYSRRKRKLSKKKLSDDKRKKKYTVVTKLDYQKYYSSNDILKKAHKDNIPIKRTIIQICYSKAELTYYETKQQFIEGVLEDDKYLNRNILGRFYKFKSK